MRRKRDGPLPQSTRVCLDLVAPETLSELEELVGRKFRARALLAQAVVHSSCHFVKKGRVVIQSNEKLEHLGDSVIYLAVCSFLHRKYPMYAEDFYSQVLGPAISNDTLGEVGKTLGLERYILTPHHNVGGRRVHADTFEAICGALFLDGGLNPVEAFLARCLFPKVDEIVAQHEAALKKGPPH